MFQPTLTLTVNNAEAALDAGLQAIRDGQTEIDLSQLTAGDSAAVATLLEWKRAARTKGQALALRNVPASVISLARLYGVAELLDCPQKQTEQDQQDQQDQQDRPAAQARADLLHH